MSPNPTALDQRWVAALRHDPAPGPDLDVAWSAVDQRSSGPAHRSSRRPRAVAAAAAAAVVLLVAGLAVWRATADDAEAVHADLPVDAPTGTWERLDDLPLSERAQAVTFWVGGELVVAGGDTFLCPDGADCMVQPEDRSLTDGVALDPETGAWRPITDSPVPFSRATVAVVGTDAYLLTSALESRARAFLRYSAAGDTWAELPLPADDPGWYSLRAAGDAVLAVSGSDDAGARADLVFDPVAETWEPLPDDPFPASFDRVTVWSAPHVYLFAKQMDRLSGPTPNVLQVARLDLDSRTWEHLPDSDRIGYGPWFAEDGTITSPERGGSDGGTVNGFDRRYAEGGSYDIATGEWRDLPDAPPGTDDEDAQGFSTSVAGIVGREGASWLRPEGIALDVTGEAWIEVPARPTGRRDERPIVATAGRDLVVVGGYRWPSSRQPEPEMLTETWIWRAP